MIYFLLFHPPTPASGGDWVAMSSRLGGNCHFHLEGIVGWNLPRWRGIKGVEFLEQLPLYFQIFNAS